MRTLFVMDPLDRIQVAGDSTFVLMRESQARGFPIAFCTPDQVTVQNNRPWATATPVRVSDTPPHFEVGVPVDEPLDAFDTVWMRKDPPFHMEYVFTTYLLDLATKARVWNDPRSIKLAQEKLYALQWPDLCPSTTFAKTLSHVRAFAAQHDKIVLKPWDGNGGRGVVVTHARDKNLGALVELLTDEGRRSCIAQEYLPEITTGDKRILLVDGEPRGWFLRVPGEQDHRGNMHVGASVQACELTARDQEICAAIGPRLKAEGLLFVGIDVIGDRLTEINVTSPTGLVETLDLMGRDLGAELVDASVRLR